MVVSPPFRPASARDIFELVLDDWGMLEPPSSSSDEVVPALLPFATARQTNRGGRTVSASPHLAKQ